MDEFGTDESLWLPSDPADSSLVLLSNYQAWLQDLTYDAYFMSQAYIHSGALGVPRLRKRNDDTKDGRINESKEEALHHIYEKGYRINVVR